jgi:NADH-quinone oxidoreductase subunit L
MNLNPTLLVLIPLLPLIAAFVAGVFGKVVGRAGAHTITILGVAASCVLSMYVLKQIVWDGVPTYNAPVYTWLISDGMKMDVGFLIDRLTALMMVVVTFVSLCVHVYTIGYMSDDPGYQRFFAYISLFTFSMLMLVMSNNFMQLFFGWEAVGMVSYLLIGFWYTRPSAIFANMKAFLVNRVGDFGFVLGIAGIAYYTNSLNYTDAFAAAPKIAQAVIPMGAHSGVDAITCICICLFIGAMGKSAQVPLHVWLPDSMEGPTPISALIHAATMVTAGIFMVARMSPLFEHSETALSFVLVIGATTAFFMGLLGVVNNDIKRVIAYSTLSQLGYMTVALGASAYSAGIFHLMTHAFFKALLFLAAGSVIIGMHHEQDMRKMGGLAKYMPITAITSWIGTLALVGTPFFAGFYSKDAIIEAVGESHRWGATYAYWCVMAGVFVTSLYSFRLLFMTFHGPERFRHKHGAHHGDASVGHEEEDKKPAARGDAHDSHAKHDDHGHDDHGHGHGAHEPHESPVVVTLPLILLAIPSVLIGFLTISSVLFGNYFGDAIQVMEEHNVVAELGKEWHGPVEFALHGFMTLPFLLLVLGALTAWLFFLKKPSLANSAAKSFGWLREIFLQKYYFDWFNQTVIAGLTRALGFTLWKAGDQAIIDGAIVNGSANTMRWFGSVIRRVQNGYLYSYAFWMVIGLAVLLGWFLKTRLG